MEGLCTVANWRAMLAEARFTSVIQVEGGATRKEVVVPPGWGMA
jgi:hypothetical protein